MTRSAVCEACMNEKAVNTRTVQIHAARHNGRTHLLPQHPLCLLSRGGLAVGGVCGRVGVIATSTVGDLHFTVTDADDSGTSLHAQHDTQDGVGSDDGKRGEDTAARVTSKQVLTRGGSGRVYSLRRASRAVFSMRCLRSVSLPSHCKCGACVT